MSESVKTLVSTFWNIGVEDGCTESLLLVSDNEESEIRDETTVINQHSQNA
jgi:hypothetical protein